jgi:hypothetical protein
MLVRMLKQTYCVLQTYNIAYMLLLTTDNLRCAQELYGNPPEYVHGKLTNKKVSSAIVHGDLILNEKRQTLHMEVIHIDGCTNHYV